MEIRIAAVIWPPKHHAWLTHGQLALEFIAGNAKPPEVRPRLPGDPHQLR